MKKICLFIFLIPFYHYVFGQIVSYNFDNANCPTSPCGDGGGIINPQCLNDWGTSHGSPSLISNAEAALIKMTINGEAAFLITGDGLFVNYPFCDDQCYKITYKLSIGSADDTRVNLFMTDGLVNDNNGSCLESVPNITPKQQVAQFTTSTVGSAHSHFTLNNVPKEITHIFSPLTNYGQLWIYPDQGTSNTIILHEITIEALCMPTLVYDDPNKDIPFGLHRARQGICPILVQSPSGSSGYIENNTSKYTELNAPAICIKTNTWIKSSATGSFLAKLDLCPVGFNAPDCNGPQSLLSPELSNENNYAISRLSHDIRVVPNPSSDGIFDVLMPQESNLLFEYGNVYDLFGRVIQRIKIQNESELKIDLSNQPPNIYYLKLQPFKEYLGQRSYKDTLIRLVKTN